MSEERGAALLDRSRLGELLDALGRDSVVYAPVATQEPGTPVELAVVAGPDVDSGAAGRVTLDFSNTRHSVKRLFFPQTEVMLRFDNDAITPGPALNEAGAPGGVVAFGVRPCDAMALTYLDKVFAAGITRYADPYYTGRRERSVIVALSCSAPCAGCFCMAVGGGPAGRQGADLLVTTLSGERLHFQPLTDKGGAAMEAARGLFAPADAAASREVGQAHERAEKAVPALPTPDGRVDRDALKAAMDRAFETQIWKGLTESCIGCGACTYLCPTCHCFDVSDEERHYAGRRIRTWDSCQYALFTRHASGHNPRQTREQRLRQRFMHKFSYTVEKTGDMYCVGCGRCVVHCPVNLDIREVIGAFSAPGA